MKFTEEQAREALVAKMTSKGETLQVSKRTMSKLLNTFYKKFVSEETELDDFVNDYVDDFKELDGNMRKEKSDFAKEFEAKNQKNKANDKDEKDTEDKEKTETQKLLERIEKLEQEKAAADKAKAISTKKNELVNAIKAKGVSDEAWIKSVLSKANIAEELDIEKESDDYISIYNKQQAYINPNATPNASGGGAAMEEDFSDIKDAVKRNKGVI